MASLKERRWFNPSLPQMLQIAVFLLYFEAFFALLDALDGLRGANLRWLVLAWARVPIALLGGLWLSEERKRGYQLAVVAAIYPFALRLLIAVGALGALNPFSLAARSPARFVILGNSILSFAFEVALVVLLLHVKSREHVKIWFR